MCPLKAGGGLSVKGFDWAFRGPRRAVSLVLGSGGVQSRL